MTTTPDSPAALLRQAASLMRERAGKASPGPWFSWQEGRDGRGGASFIGAPDADLYVTVGMHGEDAHDRWSANQDFIASMHPLVALPVADWLETEAIMVEERGNSVEGQTFHALAVARAYLDGAK
jgi:hypothetical protein